MGNALRFPYGQCCSEPPSTCGVPMFELHTLSVDPKAVADGDVVTVYVDTSDARESTLVPTEIQIAAIEHKEARAQGNYAKQEALYTLIKDAGYMVRHINKEILARKYRIRLRGIDAPKIEMPYGIEAKKKAGGDCWIEESMLKEGFACHYIEYDTRPEFKKWEKGARAKEKGLWKSLNPEKPWEWRKRKNQREQR